MTSQEIMVTLQREVGEWSKTNFGDQSSKTHSPCILGPVAPILGIVEELGEMVEAIQNKDMTLVKDAVADVLIYLADFFVRIGHTVVLDWEYIDTKLYIECGISTPEKTTAFILKWLGQFAHVNLKHHQGIRGYDQNQKYLGELGVCTCELLIGMGRLYSCAKSQYFQQNNVDPSRDDILAYRAVTSHELLMLAFTEWQTVKQRNWKTNAVTGA